MSECSVSVPIPSPFPDTPTTLWPSPRPKPIRVFLATVPYDIMSLGYGIKKKTKRIYGYTPPLGLGQIARCLKEYGCEVTLNNSGPIGNSYETLLDKLVAFKPDVIGFSIFTANLTQSIEMVKLVKSHPVLSKALLLIGGPHVYTFRHQALVDIPADIGVWGEAEADVIEIMEFYDKKRLSLRQVNGILFRENGMIDQITETHSAKSLDHFGFPDWSLYNFDLYHNIPGQVKRLPMTSMVTSRGCPYRCNFCFQTGRFADKYRRYTPERTIQEIEFLVKNYGIKEIQFWDDIFLLNKNWVKKFCDLLREKKLDITWSGYARVNLVDRDLLRMVADHGCWNIFYGYETGTQKQLDFLNKDITLEQCFNATKWTKDAGIVIRGSFMLGLPNETPELARKTIKFALDFDPDYANFNIFFPEPGTGLYELALKQGRLLSTKYLGRTTPVYMPEGYSSPEEIRQLQKEAFRRFYFRPRYIWNRAKRMRRMDEFMQYLDGARMLLSTHRKEKFAFATEAPKTERYSRNVF